MGSQAATGRRNVTPRPTEGFAGTRTEMALSPTRPRHSPSRAKPTTATRLRGASRRCRQRCSEQRTDSHLRAILHLTQALHGLGVTVRFDHITDTAVGDWYSYTQTAIVRHDAHPGNQAWFLGQLLAFLTAGPAGSPAAEQQRNLRLVID